jgi:MFS family permease
LEKRRGIQKPVNRVARWLVQEANRETTLDLEAVASDREGEIRRNRLFHTADGVAYWAGINAVSYNTVVPLFVSKLTDSPLLIGLVAVFSQAGWYLPQLLTARATERVAYKRPIVVRLGFLIERVPALFWPVAALISGRYPSLGLGLFLASFGMHFVGAGLIAPGWQDLIAHTFPPQDRGRFFGLTTFLGTTLGAIGGFGASRLLGAYSFPLDFVIAFAIAAVLIQTSWIFLALSHEPMRVASAPAATLPSTAATRPPPSGPARLRGGNLRDTMEIVKRDAEFSRFLLVRTLMGLGTMGFGFVAVYTAKEFGTSDAGVALFTVALLFGEATGNLSAGTLADQLGHRYPLLLGTGSVTAAFAVALFASAGWVFYLVFALMGYAIGAGRVAAMMIVMEFAPADRTPTYVGITNSLAGAGGLIAPLVGSVLAGFSYPLLFGVSTAINLAALVGLFVAVQDPRRRSGQDR